MFNVLCRNIKLIFSLPGRSGFILTPLIAQTMRILMKKIKLFFSPALLLLCFHSLVFAQANVDFSKSYVIHDESNVDKLTIGGVKPLWSDLFYSVEFILNPEYNLNIVGALNQSGIQEQLEQGLRNTTWVGKYLFDQYNFTTTLNLVVVQDGYVGGEIVHGEINNADGYLHSRVTGDIITQYQIGSSFIDEDRILPDVLASLPLDTPTKQLIRIKRVRALQFQNGSLNGWSTNREYRMRLENGLLTGSVGVPDDLYGSGDVTNENGSILLSQQN